LYGNWRANDHENANHHNGIGDGAGHERPDPRRRRCRFPQKRREELQTKREALFTELNDVRKSIEKSDAVAAAQKALADAKILYEAKIAESPRIVAAKKAMDDAAAQVKAITDQEVAADPQVIEAQKAIAAADDAYFDAQSELRIAEYVLSEMKRKAARNPDLKALKVKDNAASEAYYAARKAGKGVDAAKAAREASTKELDEAISAKVAASPQGQAQLKKIADLEAKVKETRLAMQPLNAKLSDARSKAATAGPKVTEARKAADAAAQAYRDTLHDEAEIEKAKVDDAAKALDDLVTTKLAAEPKVIELRKQMEGIREQIKEVSAQVKAQKAK
jgi:hypothetical protein